MVADQAFLNSSGDKPPKGFEKFFRKGEDKKAKSSSKKEKKEEEKKKQEEEELSEEETETKSSKEGEKDKGSGDGAENKIKAFFFDPNNNPKWESVFLLAALGFGTGWYLYNFKAPMKEIVYMEFLNDYLLQNRIKQIDLVKDRRSDVFNHRAEITTHDGSKVYLVLNSFEQFLAKLDLVQREMGKATHDYIPVKFTSQE